MAESRRFLFEIVVIVLLFLIYFTIWRSIDEPNIFPKFKTKPRKNNTGQRRLVSGICRSKQSPEWNLVFSDKNNNEWPWNENLKVNCTNYYYNQYALYRRKTRLDCSSDYPRLVTSLTNSPSDVQVVEPSDKCLHDYIRHCCNDKGYPVPNVLHYVWYSNVDVAFVTMASFISVLRFLQPCLIVFHGPFIPKGEFWNFFISVLPYIIVVNQTLTVEVFGHRLKYREHGSDIDRINALREYGGVYLDWDQLLVRPIDFFRKFDFTMSLEESGKLGNQFMMSKPNATFLALYYYSYKYYNGEWVYNSMHVPFNLSEKYPHLINRLPYTGIRPKYLGLYEEHAVLESESSEGLQQLLADLESYCRKWS